MTSNFIVGVPRSGTTLLVNLLGQHPLLAPIYETRFLRNLLSLCEAARWYRGSSPSRRLLGMFAEPLVRRRFVRKCQTYRRKVAKYARIPDKDRLPLESRYSLPFGTGNYILYDFEDLVRETDEWISRIHSTPLSGDAFCDSAREYVDRLFAIHCSRSNKPHWINKTPGLLRYLRLIPMLYPNGKCIHIIRDGRDVALSTRATSWGAKTVRNAARRWKELILEGRKNVDPSRLSYMEMHYEELARSPEEQLKRAIDFLELKGDSTEVPITFPVSQNSVGIWRSKLTKEEREIFAGEAGDLLIELDYETDYRWVFE